MLGKSIKSLLAASSALSNLVSTRIYPYVAPSGTELPLVVYTIDSVDPSYNKGGWANDDYSFTVFSFARDYAGLQSIATEVRAALELKDTGYGSQDINKIYLRGMEEAYDYEADVFYNKLNFSVTVNTY